jgi:hypothetical protein
MWNVGACPDTRYVHASTNDEIDYVKDSFCLLNEELRNLYSSPNIIRMIKSRRMRWTDHVALIGEEEHVWVTLEKPEERDH